MKAKIVFIGILILIIVGALYLKDKDHLFSDAKGKIAPVSEWSAILRSKWKYEYEEKSEQEDWIHQGEIEFFSDSSFKLFLSIKNLEGRISESPTGGGSVSGFYLFDNDSTFRLVTKECNIEATGSLYNDVYKKKFCNQYELVRFGSGYVEDSKKLEVLEFNEKVIRFKGKLLKNNASIVYSLTKIES